MKRFILHVGFHKTATSSIQQTLDKNRDKLEQQGYIYPRFQRGGEEMINHSIPFYSAFCKQPELYHINIKNSCIDNIAAINNDYLMQFNQFLALESNLIVSGEDISVLHPEALIQLRDIIKSKGFKLEVYCSVRKPYSFTCSELQEKIKSGNGTLTNIIVPQKSEFIHKLKKVFNDSITFFSFEEDCKTELGPVNRFLERIGLNPKEFKLINDNEGFGNISTRFLAYLNLTHPSLDGGKLSIKGRGFFSESIDKEKFILSKTELNSISEQLDVENLKMKSLLGDVFCDQNYRTIDDDYKLDLNLSFKLIDTYTNNYTYLRGLIFVLNHRNFEVNALIIKLDQNADIFREVAIHFKNKDIKVAISFITAAKRLRPNGPVICKIYDELKGNDI
jgi:hypothetical protein